MTDRADLIRMAREAGFREPNPHDGCMGLVFGYRNGSDSGASLERFAALAAAAERKRIETSRPPRMSVSIERVRQEEREACAKLCDERSAGWDQVKIVRDDVEACMNAAAKNEARALGVAIRARAEPVTREQRRAHDEQYLTQT